MAGIHVANCFVANDIVRDKLNKALDQSFAAECNSFAEAALVGAYDKSEEWLDELNEYIEGNIDYFVNYIQNEVPKLGWGEWNTSKIVCYKGTVVHYQNDVPVVEYHLWTPQWTEMLQKSKFSEEKWPVAFQLLNNCGGENHEGYIGFQDHGDDVWYRNIKVKVLE